MTLPILAMLLTIAIMIPGGTIISTSTTKTKTIVFAEATTPPPSLMISPPDPRDFRIRPSLDLRGGSTVIDDDDNNGRDDNPSPFSPPFSSFTTVISSTRLRNNMQWKQQRSSSRRHDMSFLLNQIRGGGRELKSPTRILSLPLPLTSKLSSLPPSGLDQFVSSSPLTVAAVCSDGVAIVAYHSSGDIEPLLFSSINSSSSSMSYLSPHSTSSWNEDLPQSSRGPLRIEEIDSSGTCVTSVGWRTDSSELVDKLRSFVKTEVGRYGHGEVDDTNCNDSNHNSCGDRETLEYGQRVSSMLGHWMASREYSDTMRTIHAACLVAFAGKQRNTVSSNLLFDDHDNEVSQIPHTNNDGNFSQIIDINRINDKFFGGYLFLVDSTGCHRVRAHAVGCGSRLVNDILLRVDFLTMSVEEGVAVLIKLVRKANGDCNNNLDNDKYTFVGRKGEDDSIFLEKDNKIVGNTTGKITDTNLTRDHQNDSMTNHNNSSSKDIWNSINGEEGETQEYKQYLNKNEKLRMPFLPPKTFIEAACVMPRVTGRTNGKESMVGKLRRVRTIFPHQQLYSETKCINE